MSRSNGHYNRDHSRADLYRADREKGMTYQQIADKYGVSRQAVGQVCGKWNPHNFKVVTGKCVYPNLRKWQNDNKVSQKELVRRMGLTAYAGTCTQISAYTTGLTDPPKYIIDKMIEVTGLPYEVLFYREDKNGKE